MKILMLCDSMDCGGAETHVLTLSSALVARGHEVYVVSRGGRLVKELLRAEVKHLTLQFSARSPLSMLSYRAKLCRLLKKESFDVVHAHSRLTSFLAQSVVTRHKKAFIVTAHAHFSASPLRRRLSRWGNSTIAVSEDIKQYLVKNYSLLANKVTVIPNGVDEKRFYPKEICGESPAAPKIAFLSRLDFDCSLGAYLLCDIAEDIFEKHPDASVIIGGAGSEFKAISSRASEVNRRLGKEFVVCVGAVDDAASFLRSANIFVGVSRAAIEAGLSGMPIILCGNEGFGGILTHQNFEVAAASNFCARDEVKANAPLLKKNILSLICNPYSTDAQKVRELFLKSYSLKSFAERTEEIYKSTPRLYSRGRADTLLCGYYGYGNVGDDALLTAALDRAQREFPNEKIALLTKNGRKDTQCFGANCIKRSSPVALLFAISRCKRLIFGGGTLLQSSTSRRSLLYYSALLIFAGSLKKECILWANGIELPHGAFCRRLLRAAMKNCSYIGARDTRSLAIAKELAPKAASVYEKDLAEGEYSKNYDSGRVNFLLRSTFKNIPKRFVIAVPKAKASGADIALLTKLLAKARKEKSEVLIIPMCFQEDGALCRQLCKSLGARLLEGACFDDIVGLARECSCVYSMRYHGLIAASLADAESIGIGKSEKMEIYCKENGIKRIFAHTDI